MIIKTVETKGFSQLYNKFSQLNAFILSWKYTTLTTENINIISYKKKTNAINAYPCT